MKKVVTQILLIISFATNIGFAQNTLLAGRLVDINNKPIAGAVIEVATGRNAIKTTTDKDGLYYTSLFPAGKYKVSIYNNSHSYKVQDINIAARDKAKKFYNFQLTASTAIVHIDDQDPFMAVAFNKVEANQHLNDFPVIKRNTHVEHEGGIIDGNGIWREMYINDSNQVGKSLDSSPLGKNKK